MTMSQPGLFDTATLQDPNPVTTVRLDRQSVQIRLRKKRRQAIKRLMEVLTELEGKDVYVGSYDAGGRHFWLDNLKLSRLQLEWHPKRYGNDPNYLPSVIAFRGSKSACVRIFTEYLTAVREQEYQGYWLYLLDFHNGFWQSPLDRNRSHYASLVITRFKE